MKLVVFRYKKNNQISHCHEANIYCTNETLEEYNGDEQCAERAEIVELKEDSLAYYFYQKSRKILGVAEDLRKIMNDLTNITDRIDSHLCDVDTWFKSKKGEEE